MSVEIKRPEKVIPEKVVGFAIGEQEVVISSKNAILYALGIGIGSSPLCPRHLKYVYELAEDFAVFPTITTVLLDASKIFETLSLCPGLPDFNPMALLHGEQSVTIFSPLRLDTKYLLITKIKSIEDKGKGALLCIESRGHHQSALVFINEMGLFIRGMNNFASPVTSLKSPGNTVKGQSVVVKKQLSAKTASDQAILYRLNGDLNPLHVDMGMAEVAGFERPILHGLCTFGVVAKEISMNLLNNQPETIKSISARFVGHLFPGETLDISTSVSKDHPSIITFDAVSRERKTRVITGKVEVSQPIAPKL